MRGLPILGLMLFTLGACSANVSSPGESDADALTQTTAVVTFERTTTTGEAGHEIVRGAATARFVQARSPWYAGSQTSQAFQISGLDDRALKLVGAAFDAPPSFGCVALSDELDAAAGRALELADVGGLQVVQTSGQTALGARTFPLVARQVPDPVGLVGGVIYYAPAASVEPGSQVIPGSRYSVRAAGSPGVASFEISGAAPLDVSDVRLASANAGAPNARVAIPAQAVSVELAWSTADASVARETGDVFFVDVAVQRGAGSTGGTLRCAADASGATIPGSAFSALPPDGEGTFAVHRVHRERVRAGTAPTSSSPRGPLESSELRFDFSRVIAFSRR